MCVSEKMKHMKADEHQGNKAERDIGWLKKGEEVC